MIGPGVEEAWGPLVDWQLEAAGLVDPSCGDLFAPNSIDLRLSGVVRRERPWPGRVTVGGDGDDAFGPPEWCDGEVEIGAGEFVLASTVERVSLPAGMVGLVVTKSTTARLGLSLAVGLVDSGWDGTITLEIANQLRLHAVVVPVGEPICRLMVWPTTRPARSYESRGRYQGQVGPTPARPSSG